MKGKGRTRVQSPTHLFGPADTCIHIQRSVHACMQSLHISTVCVSFSLSVFEHTHKTAVRLHAFCFSHTKQKIMLVHRNNYLISFWTSISINRLLGTLDSNNWMCEITTEAYENNNNNCMEEVTEVRFDLIAFDSFAPLSILDITKSI